MDETEENISDISCSSSILPSTPTSGRNARKRVAALATSTPVFKLPRGKPKTRKGKGPIVGVCEKCGKDYVRKKSYEDHMRLHALVDANSRYPDAQQLHSHILEISRRVVMKMSQIQSVGPIGKEHNAFVQHLLHTQPLAPEWSEFCSLVGGIFIDSLLTGKFLMPSVLLPVVYKVADSILVNLPFRQKCFELLEKINPMTNSENMIQCFVCSFVHDVGAEIIIFICESVIGEKPKKKKEVIQFNIEERQVIFYVSGCTFHQYVKKGKRWKNTEWTAISEAVESRVREGNGVPLCAQSDRAWTESQNRVNLFFIGAPAMEFMMQVAQCVYNVDSDQDGCFKDEDILKDVFEDNVALLLWDELIGNALDDNLSIRLLKGVVTSFTSTYARGVALKKLNQHLKKAFHSISLRHSIAPRQEK